MSSHAGPTLQRAATKAHESHRQSSCYDVSQATLRAIQLACVGRSVKQVGVEPAGVQIPQVYCAHEAKPSSACKCQCAAAAERRDNDVTADELTAIDGEVCHT